jgi:hypothetical protein
MRHIAMGKGRAIPSDTIPAANLPDATYGADRTASKSATLCVAMRAERAGGGHGSSS